MRHLGPPTKRYRVNGGLNTLIDPVLIRDDQWQSGTRVRTERGILQKDEGYAVYGDNNAATSNPRGIFVHQHEANPRTLYATGDDLYWDSDGAGTWASIHDYSDDPSGERTQQLSFAGQKGITFIANGYAPTQVFKGAAATVAAPDIPSPDECPAMEGFDPSTGGIAPYPSDNIIHQLDGFTPVIANTGTCTFTNGSPTVTGSGTQFQTDNVRLQMGIKSDTDGTWYEIQSVDSETQITLEENYADAGGAGHAYTIAGISGNGATISVESGIIFNSTGSIKVVTDGSVYGEGLAIDLGSGNEIDLSDSDYLGVWLYVTDAGNWLNLKFSEDASTWQEYPLNVEAEWLNKWIFFVWDVRGIVSTSCNAVRYFRISTNATLGRTFYADYLMHSGGLYGEYTYAFSFYDSETKNESPIGRFRKVTTLLEDEAAQMSPARVVVFPTRNIRQPDGADTLRIYRTMGGGDQFYKITDIDIDGQTTWSYTDSKADAKLEEADRLVRWPGQCPRAKLLVPHANRLYHIGGTAVVARNENSMGTIAAGSLNTATSDTTNATRFPDVPIYACEVKVGTAGTDTVNMKLQRSAVGAATWTTVATGTLTNPGSANTWYRIVLTPTDVSDVFYPGEYDWRLYIDGACSNITLHRAWTDSGTTFAYRLLGRVDNYVFMSNLGEFDRIPPMAQDDQPTDATTGGFVVVNQHDGQTIQTALPHGSDVLLLKNRRGYILTGESMDELDVVPVLPSMGTLSPLAGTDCDGAAAWIAQDKQVYLWSAGNEDGKPIWLSEAVREFFDGQTEAVLAAARTLYWRRRLYVFLPTAASGSRCRMYDFDEGTWNPSFNLPVYAAIPYEPDGTNETPYALIVNTNVQVAKLFGVETDAGSGIAWAARNADDDFAELFGPTSEKLLRAYRLVYKNSSGSAQNIVVKWHVDRGSSATRTYTESMSASTLGEIQKYVDNDIRGQQLSFELSGTHSAKTQVIELDVWVRKVR